MTGEDARDAADRALDTAVREWLTVVRPDAMLTAFVIMAASVPVGGGPEGTGYDFGVAPGQPYHVSDGLSRALERCLADAWGADDD